MCIETLRGEGIEPVGFWYNPNIHPFTEYRSRRNCLRDYSAAIGLRLIERNDYGLRPFVRAVADDLDFDDFYFKNYCVGSPSALMRGLVFAS